MQIQWGLFRALGGGSKWIWIRFKGSYWSAFPMIGVLILIKLKEYFLDDQARWLPVSLDIFETKLEWEGNGVRSVLFFLMKTSASCIKGGFKCSWLNHKIGPAFARLLNNVLHFWKKQGPLWCVICLLDWTSCVWNSYLCLGLVLCLGL